MDVLPHVISPDSTRVVYVADQDQDEVYELFSAPIDGSSAPVRLNAPLVAGGDVFRPRSFEAFFRVSADSARVLYVADQDTDDVFELFSAPIDGSSAPIKLSGPLVAGGDVDNANDVFEAFRISADGTRVVYVADEDTDDVWELYSVPLDGSSAPVKLNGPLVAGGLVSQFFQILPDSSRVVYVADQDIQGLFELYSAPIDGSSVPVKLNDSLVAGGGIGPFQLSPDSARVVYRAVQDRVEVAELFSVPSDGSGPPKRLNPRFVTRGRTVSGSQVARDTGSDVLEFGISPDSSRVVYEADQDRDEVFELYSVPIDRSSAPVKLNGPLVPGGDVVRGGSFRISEDSARVVFLADQDSNDVVELYTSPIDGSSLPLRLSGTLAAGGDVVRLEISPDSSRVVYLARQGVDELFSVPIDGSAGPVRLSGTLGFGGSVSFFFAIAPDSSRVVYEADQEEDGFEELYSAPTDGSAGAVNLSDLAPGGHPRGFIDFRISPDSGRVTFVTDRYTDEVFELFSVPSDGSAGPVVLNPTLAPGALGGDVASFQVSSDSRTAVYLADADVDQRFELFSVPTRGHAGPVRLNGTLIPGADVIAFEISSDADRVAYLANPDDLGIQELFSAPIDGSAAPIRVSGPLIPGGDVLFAQLSPDGDRLVYLADQEADSVFELFSVPIDGSAAPVKLNGPLVPGGDVLAPLDPSEGRFAPDSAFQISPDSSRVVYCADQDANDVVELYSAPIDGSASPVKLNGLLVPGGQVQRDGSPAFRISPDSSRVVYRADQDALGVIELYSVPIDRSSAPVKLSGPLVPGGDVAPLPSFQVSPDGSRVVYAADQLVDGRVELYGVPIDGSSPSIRLEGAQVSHSLPVFSLTPDGARVVFHGDPVSGRFELFSVPSDGSSAPVRLNGTLVAGGDVQSNAAGFPAFRISPDGGRVVYTADQLVDNVVELFSAPIDGSSAPVKLNGPLPAAGDVQSGNLEFGPDGTRVIYRADQRLDEVFELFDVPVLGGSGPFRLSGPLVTGGDVQLSGSRNTPDGRRVLYLADQETDGVVELYATSSPHVAR